MYCWIQKQKAACLTREKGNGDLSTSLQKLEDKGEKAVRGKTAEDSNSQAMDQLASRVVLSCLMDLSSARGSRMYDGASIENTLAMNALEMAEEQAKKDIERFATTSDAADVNIMAKMRSLYVTAAYKVIGSMPRWATVSGLLDSYKTQAVPPFTSAQCYVSFQGCTILSFAHCNKERKPVVVNVFFFHPTKTLLNAQLDTWVQLS